MLNLWNNWIAWVKNLRHLVHAWESQIRGTTVSLIAIRVYNHIHILRILLILLLETIRLLLLLRIVRAMHVLLVSTHLLLKKLLLLKDLLLLQDGLVDTALIQHLLVLRARYSCLMSRSLWLYSRLDPLMAQISLISREHIKGILYLCTTIRTLRIVLVSILKILC